jgi:hypothetical protein
MDTEFINALTKKMQVLREEKNKKNEQLKVITDEVELIQRSIDNIAQLLKFEDVQFEQSSIHEVTQETVAELAYSYLSTLSQKQPKHYSEIANAILTAGKPLPGKDKAANLLTHITRDKRFVRVSRGTYGLLEWGLKAPATQGKRKAKSSIRKRMGK